jgi:ornithine cyclodeaminase
VICCFDPDNGTPLAMMDGTYITATRTAAASALATRLLARRDASVLAIVGTGVQARTHAVAVVRVRDVQRVLIAGRKDDAVVALVEELAALGIPAEAGDSFEDAVRAADIVCAATHADQPVVRRAWLRPGAHVNSVGYNTAGTGEVDAETIRDAVVVVELRDAALAPPPSGSIEIRNAVEQGTITPDHIRAELGELVAGTATGRSNDDEITLYKSVGVAVQDAAAAALVLRAAREKGIGTEVEI